jgi:pimeloyl-ACP methyl ester carboxylesterase
MADWILLRGLTREARHWDDMPDALRAAGVLGNDDRLVALDLPGNGALSAVSSPTSVTAMTTQVRTAALGAGLTPPYRLFAMSLGGMVAVDWAQRHALEIDAMVLINTSLRPFSRAWERLRPQAWPAAWRIGSNWQDAARCETGIHALTCARSATRDADVTRWTAIRQSAPVTRVNALRQLAAAARYRAASRRPACATLVLSSRGDGLVSPACSRKLAEAWHLPHRIHPWAGHDLPHDDPAWVARAVSTWLAESMPA